MWPTDDVKHIPGLKHTAHFEKLQVAYNDALRLLLRRPQKLSAEMFVNAHVNTLNAVVRNLISTVMCQMDASENQFINSLTDSNYSGDTVAAVSF